MGPVKALRGAKIRNRSASRRYAGGMVAKKRAATLSKINSVRTDGVTPTVEEQAQSVLRRAANELADLYLATGGDARLSGALQIIEVLGVALRNQDTRSVNTTRVAAEKVEKRNGQFVDLLSPEDQLASNLVAALRATPRTKLRGVAAWLYEAVRLFPALRIYRPGEVPWDAGGPVDRVLETISAVSLKASHVAGASPRSRAQLCRCVVCEAPRILRAMLKRRAAK
jgi:hypothetical protein